MKPKAKKFLSNFFFGLISNDHAIEGSKSNPWWVALIIALFATVLPVIPITVSQAKTYGASFLSSNTYRFDQNISDATVQLLKDNKEFKVENKQLTYYSDNAAVVTNETTDVTPIYQHLNSSTKQLELTIYYTQREKKVLSNFITEISSKVYKVNSTDVPEEGYEGGKYSPSFVVLSAGGIYTRINQDDSVNVGSGTYTAFSSDWKHFKEGFALLSNALPAEKTKDQVDLTKSEDVSAIFNNWKTYYNKAYITQKTYNTWMTSLLFWGIYVGLVFVLGVLVFLLTRGKNNMFNYLKFFDTQKIVWWASLSPAILGMILGFIFPNFAQMMFIILIGMRVMWISMKQLRPQY